MMIVKKYYKQNKTTFCPLLIKCVYIKSIKFYVFLEFTVDIFQIKKWILYKKCKLFE